MGIGVIGLVRPLPLAALLSTVFHAAALAWVGTHDSKLPRTSVVTVETTPARVDAEPVAVALLDDHTVSAVRALPISRTAAVAISTGHTSGTNPELPTPEPPTPEPPAPEPPTPGHQGLMTMRRPELKNGVSSDFVDHFLEKSKPLAPNDDESEQVSDEIASAKGHLDDPRWIANATPDDVRNERLALAEHRDDAANEELQPSANGHHKVGHPGFTADVERDGTVHIKDDRNLRVVGACDGDSWLCKIPIGAVFDVTDWAMRSRGIDPYAAAKLKMLDDTRDQRVAIGTQYRKERLSHSVELVQGAIAYVWANTRDPAARKAALFELWDDCAEIGDAEVVESGRAVRAFIVGFIRSNVSYTAAELAELNARRHSKATFAPYE